MSKESLRIQIDRLAQFILDEVPGEPSRSEGAVDTAIRIIKQALARKVTPMLSSVVKGEFLATLKAEIDYHAENGDCDIKDHLASLKNIRKFIQKVETKDAAL